MLPPLENHPMNILRGRMREADTKDYIASGIARKTLSTSTLPKNANALRYETYATSTVLSPMSVCGEILDTMQNVDDLFPVEKMKGNYCFAIWIKDEDYPNAGEPMVVILDERDKVVGSYFLTDSQIVHFEILRDELGRATYVQRHTTGYHDDSKFEVTDEGLDTRYFSYLRDDSITEHSISKAKFRDENEWRIFQDENITYHLVEGVYVNKELDTPSRKEVSSGLFSRKVSLEKN